MISVKIAVTGSGSLQWIEKLFAGVDLMGEMAEVVPVRICGQDLTAIIVGFAGTNGAEGSPGYANVSLQLVNQEAS
jgi:hypothetical protein